MFSLGENIPQLRKLCHLQILQISFVRNTPVDSDAKHKGDISPSHPYFPFALDAPLALAASVRAP
jgi:hypothetical protein